MMTARRDEGTRDGRTKDSARENVRTSLTFILPLLVIGRSGVVSLYADVGEGERRRKGRRGCVCGGSKIQLRCDSSGGREGGREEKR